MKALDATEVGAGRLGVQDRNNDVECGWPVQRVRVRDKMERLKGEVSSISMLVSLRAHMADIPGEEYVSSDCPDLRTSDDLRDCSAFLGTDGCKL